MTCRCTFGLLSHLIQISACIVALASSVHKWLECILYQVTTVQATSAHKWLKCILHQVTTVQATSVHKWLKCICIHNFFTFLWQFTKVFSAKIYFQANRYLTSGRGAPGYRKFANVFSAGKIFFSSISRKFSPAKENLLNGSTSCIEPQIKTILSL